MVGMRPLHPATKLLRSVVNLIAGNESGITCQRALATGFNGNRVSFISIQSS